MNGLKQTDALSPLPFNFALELPKDGSRKPRWLQINGTNQLI